MEIELKEETDNPVLGRTEVSFSVEHFGEETPRRSDVGKKLSALKDADDDLVVVKRMDTEYGKPVTRGEANVYSDRDRMEMVEPEHLIERNSGWEPSEEPEEPAESEEAEEEAEESEEESAEEEPGPEEESAEEAGEEAEESEEESAEEEPGPEEESAEETGEEAEPEEESEEESAEEAEDESVDEDSDEAGADEESEEEESG